MACATAFGLPAWVCFVIALPLVRCNTETQKDTVEPEFLSAMSNVTVALGREAVLVCSVKNIGEHKVGWLKAEDQTILSLHERVVTENRRIDIDVDNNTFWRLKIRQLQRSDKGCYMCQINTQVMKKQIGCVDVKVPPDIKDEETISDVTIKEGENATLGCKAKGNPAPKITWRREDGQKIALKNKAKKIMVEKVRGEPLLLNRVDRSQMGHYLCIASNDVPPAVSKRITLNINFAPIIRVTNQLLGAPLRTNVRLECFVESFPNSVNYWSNTKGEMILGGPKYYIEEIKTGYKTRLLLTVQFLDRNDLGTYKCSATNSMGFANGSIRVYEIILPTIPPTTTTTSTTTTAATTTTVTTTTTTATTSTMNAQSTTGEGKTIDKTRRRMNDIEMETKSSSHRASTSGSTRVQSWSFGQTLTIISGFALLVIARGSVEYLAIKKKT
ncbi:lachesin-like isoform X2 [Adelges cooleyi]|uniref:lachesin-like isoform X2 n=1 Tax=Adelges cooleyi TaxID=133065 RepID=UPI002180747D|nr:lachesin-like isoform X2 [Adelges cooleyi]